MDTMKNKVEVAVNAIYRRDGQVSASVLVEEAKPVESPVHDAFEWNDAKAGQEYRLFQARQWIRKVEIIVDDRREELVHVPVIVTESENDTQGREGYYKPVSVVRASSDEYGRAMYEVTHRLKSAKDSYDRLKVLDRTVKKINTKKADRGFEMVESALSRAAL